MTRVIRSYFLISSIRSSYGSFHLFSYRFDSINNLGMIIQFKTNE